MQNISVCMVSSVCVVFRPLFSLSFWWLWKASKWWSGIFRFKSHFEYPFNISVKRGAEYADMPFIFITDISPQLYRLRGKTWAIQSTFFGLKFRFVFFCRSNSLLCSETFQTEVIIFCWRNFFSTFWNVSDWSNFSLEAILFYFPKRFKVKSLCFWCNSLLRCETV
jgi:hypothetical protein